MTPGTLAHFVSKVPHRPILLAEGHARRLVCRCGAERVFTGDDAQIGHQIVQAGWLPGGTARTALQEALYGIPSDCPRCRAQVFTSLVDVAAARV